MATSQPRTWLITGASSGFGKALALYALRAGDKVIGTTRHLKNAKQSCPELETLNGIWCNLDPSSKAAGEQFLKLWQEYKIDVLVNNAGYAFLGALEDTE